MERVILWTAIVSAAIALLRLPRVIVRWAVARRLYGTIPWRLVWQMRRYLRGSPMGRLVFLTAITGYMMIILLARQLVRNDPPIGAIFGGGALSLLVVLSAEALLPPSILLLTSSSGAAARALAHLNAALPWHRTVALLRPREAMEPMQARRFFYNNLRTSNGYEWRSIVFHLMDVVPLIVIDAEEGTEPVREEQARIQRHGYTDRTLVVKPGPEAPASAHVLAAETVDREELPRHARERLAAVCDQEQRKARQQVFNEMLAAIHKRVRYATKLDLLVIKCRLIEAHEKERFVRACKGIGPKEVDGRLFEYIPSRVPRREELQFLHQSRGWEEVEAILTGIGEAIATASGPVGEFNRANIDNSLGAAARMQCRWNDAERLIQRAIRRLEPLTESATEAQDAKRELATAHFNLAEVYAGRHVDEGRPEDHRMAIDHGEQCLALEQATGFDTALTEQLLKQLRSFMGRGPQA